MQRNTEEPRVRYGPGHETLEEEEEDEEDEEEEKEQQTLRGPADHAKPKQPKQQPCAQEGRNGRKIGAGGWPVLPP
eukprot:9499544-Pyramimonas_sp.AAC.1